MFDALDTIGDGNVISKRGRLSVGLTRGIVSGNVAVNYTGGYLNNLTPTVSGVHLPNEQVPSWTTFDLNLSLAPETNSSFFKGLRFTISARNVTNKAPPLVLSTQTYNGLPTAVDLNNANVFGRILTLEVSTQF
jgi:iron complex outermembrane receptor protein